ncbi:MAG TPA: alpha/beta hydrolase [Terriglobales bacterium]|nr:alpha/beta hydrolase [Terriglobales bacterium]
MLIIFFIAALLLIVVFSGVAYQQVGLRIDQRRFPAPGRMVDIGGFRLHLYESGNVHGKATVVLESGISASSLNWRAVQGEISKFARVCSYERVGLGWSELCETDCTPASLAAQLHVLLQAGGITGPYLLVGHSFGALVVRAFAACWPDETIGLVLVDPLDPAEWTPISDEQRRMIAHGVALSRRGALAAKVGVVRLCLSLLMAGNRALPRLAAKLWSGRASVVTDRIAGQVRKMPAETWPLVAMHWKQPKCFEGMARHFECLERSVAEMSIAPALNIPVTILVGTQNEHPADPREYAKKVSPRAKLVYASGSGHWIQLDEPELVVNTVREMIGSSKKEHTGGS